MYKSYTNNCRPIMFVIVMFLLIMLNACSTSKQVAGYTIEGLSDSLKTSLPEIKPPQSIIQSDDILEIKFLGESDPLVNDINTKGGGYGGATGSPGNINYLVDQNGEIELYLLGKYKVVGLTKDQLKEKLTLDIAKYLKKPHVNVRFANFRFTMLGDVRGPGIYTVPNEKVSILDAIAMAGDFSVTAKRRSIRIIRDSSGYRESGVINFTQKTLFTSPYYYLHRNDIIIVEKDNGKAKPIEVLSTVASIVGIVSSFITLFYLIKK